MIYRRNLIGALRVSPVARARFWPQTFHSHESSSRDAGHPESEAPLRGLEAHAAARARRPFPETIERDGNGHRPDQEDRVGAWFDNYQWLREYHEPLRPLEHGSDKATEPTD